MALKDFKWFDTQATADQPGSKGALSIAGRTLQGVAAPFAAAYQGSTGYDAVRLQQQQDQADMEFQKYLAQKQVSKQELGIKQNESNANMGMMAAYLGIKPQDLQAMFSGQQGAPGAGAMPSQGMPTPNTPPPEAMMSLANGQYGDISGNSVGAINSPQMTPTDLMSKLQGSGMTPSFTNGKFSMKTPYGAMSQDQAAQSAQSLLNGSVVPSQLRGMQRTQAINAAQQIDPSYNAAKADINFAADKAGASGIEKLYNNVKTFHDTFRKNADVLLKESEGFDRSQIPLINRAIMAGQTKITGNPKASRLLAAVNTVSAEYARLTNSPGATGSVISDSARHEAQNILNGWQNDGTIKGLLDPDTGIMSVDANNRLQAIQDRRDDIKGTKSSSGSKSTGSLTKDNLFEGL